jgi:4-hydroxy-2-oxoheptanedioate aldolase
MTVTGERTVDIATWRRRLRDGETAVGTWLTLGTPLGATCLAYQGFDWLGIDLEEYSPTGSTVPSLVHAIGSTPSAAFVRSRRNDVQSVRHAMKLGASGIFIPRIGSAQQAEALLAPLAEQNAVSDVLLIVMIETVRGFDQIDEILAVPGLDACFIVPGESTMRRSDERTADTERSLSRERLAAILALCRRYGVVSGIHASTPVQASVRADEGWQLVAVASDGAMLAQTAAMTAQSVRRSNGGKHRSARQQRQAFEAGCAMLGALEHGAY